MSVTLFGITVYENDRLKALMAELDETTKDEILLVINDWHNRQMVNRELSIKRDFKEEIIRAILDV